MAVDLNEPAVKAIIARLNSSLAAEITSLNTAVTDGFTIEAPQQVLGFIPTVGLLTAFPTVGVGDAPSRFEDDLGHSRTGRHELMVIAFLQDVDQEALAWKLRRYGQAIARTVLVNPQLLGQGIWGTGLVRVNPGPTLADNPEKPKEYLSWTAITLWLKDEQD